MPRYVEDQFVKSCAEIGLKVDPAPTASGELNTSSPTFAPTVSNPSAAWANRNRPTARLTFHKDTLDDDQHLDAVLFGPGHPLYAAVDERPQ